MTMSLTMQPTHLQILDFSAQFDDFFGAIDVDSNSHFQFLIETHRGSSMDNNVDIVLNGLPFLMTYSHARQRHIATNNGYVVPILRLLTLQ